MSRSIFLTSGKLCIVQRKSLESNPKIQAFPKKIFSNKEKGEKIEIERTNAKGVPNKTLPKAQRTRGLSSSYQSNLMGHITSSNTNLDQISAS